MSNEGQVKRKTQVMPPLLLHIDPEVLTKDTPYLTILPPLRPCFPQFSKFSKIQGFQNVNLKIADLKKQNVWKTLVTDLVVRLDYFFKIDREICIIGSQKWKMGRLGFSIFVAISRVVCTMLQNLSRREVKAAWHGYFSNLQPLRFYMKSHFGEFKWSKNVNFNNCRGPGFWF